MADPDPQVSARALQRERARRQQAERLLEDKSRELFTSYEALQKAHDELQENQRQLVQAEKMASIGVLAAGVAHEINNPVGFVLGNVNSLAESLPALLGATPLLKAHFDAIEPDSELADSKAALEDYLADNDIRYLLEDIPELVADCRDGLIRIRNIVEGLRSFAREDDGHREPVDMNACALSALSLAQNQIKGERQIVQALEASSAVLASEGRITQVLLNLIVNAAQATDEGGEVTLRSQDETDYVLLDVADNGCGIPAENMDKLFTPFFTTKPPGVGTGLGLSISYGIIEHYGGSITVSSSEGEGTCFSVRLPRAA